MKTMKIIPSTMHTTVAGQRQITDWMKDQLRLGDYIDECLEVNCTELAESACQEFDLFGPAPHYDAPEELFELAAAAGEWWETEMRQ